MELDRQLDFVKLAIAENSDAICELCDYEGDSWAAAQHAQEAMEELATQEAAFRLEEVYLDIMEEPTAVVEEHMDPKFP